MMKQVSFRDSLPFLSYIFFVHIVLAVLAVKVFSKFEVVTLD